jgi:thiol-disulfide isomerase/thioredoxin
MELKHIWLFVAGFVLLAVFTSVVMSRHKHIIHGRTLIPGETWKSIIPGETRHYEGFSSDSTFYMFGVDWCPHCTSTKPTFDSLGSTQTIGGKTVQCVYVNPEKEPEKAQGFPVDGYPTLLLQKGSEHVKYSGPRTKDGFLQFLQQNA